MIEKNGAYKLNKRIKDDTFNVDKISSYYLSLQVNHSLFRFCVTDTERNRCLLLEDFQLNNITSPDQLIKVLGEIYDDHHILQAGYWKSIKLAIKNPYFSLVPNALFDKEFLKEYLELNCLVKKDGTEEILYYKQNSTDAVNIFPADKKILDWFIKSYPTQSIKIVHHTSPLIEGLLINTSSNEEPSVFIYAEKSMFTLLVVKNKKLEFINSFTFNTTEDFVYYVMFVFDQLQLNPDTSNITLWGDIVPDSPIYKKLYKYIRKISLGQKPKSLYFGYHFDEILDHSFFDLYNMHLCE